MKFLKNLGYAALVTGALGTSSVIAGEKECPTAFCEPVTVYEEGEEYLSKAVGFGDSSAYKEMEMGEQREGLISYTLIPSGDENFINTESSANVLVKPVDLSKPVADRDYTAHKTFEMQITPDPSTVKEMEKDGYTKLSLIEGELCPSKGTLALETYVRGKEMNHVLYNSEGKRIVMTKYLDTLCVSK